MYSCIVALVDDVYKSVFSVPHESTDQSSNLCEYSGKQTIHDNLLNKQLHSPCTAAHCIPNISVTLALLNCSESTHSQ